MDLLTQLRMALLQGEWATGQRLPSIRKMAATKCISNHTVINAYAQLVSEGFIEAQQGRGFFVAQMASVWEQAQEFDTNEEDADPLYKLLQAPPEQTKLGCGWLPLPWRDTEALAKAVRQTARSGQRALVEYGDIHGYLPLRKQLSARLHKYTKIELSPHQILTTLGATQALDLVSHLLIKPGDHVLIDEPCNGNLIKLIKLYGGVPIGVPRLQDGPDLVVLDQLLQGNKIKAFFCNSTYHNPTGASLSPQVAFGVLKRAIEHGFMIVEDDVYGDFYAGIRQTFAQLDDLNHVIYIGSFSKSLSASLRIGYIACASHLIEPLRHLKLLTSVAVPGFCERFVNTILTDGTYNRHVQAIQRKLMTHQKLGQQALSEYGWDFEIAPEGGMFLWVSHPDIKDLADYIKHLETKGILLMPGNSFSVSQDFRDKTRINIAHLSKEITQYFAY